MKTEKKFELYSKLKEEFFDATNLSDYGNIDFDFEINENDSTDEELVVDLELKWRDNTSVCIKISIDSNGYCFINQYEDEWEKWNSHSWRSQELWRVLFFEALDS